MAMKSPVHPGAIVSMRPVSARTTPSVVSAVTGRRRGEGVR